MTTRSSVLIVEDERIVQAHLQDLVRQAGHRVTCTAVRAQEALSSAEREAPDLVLMDVRLAAGDDGIETARILRDRHGSDVLFITAHGDPETLRRTAEVGAAGILLKPFTSDAVRRGIERALASRSERAIIPHPPEVRGAGTAVPRGARRPGDGARVLVYSHDTFGLGHLRRCLNVVSALKRRHPGLSALMVTGSPMAHRFPMPDGVEYLKLPAVRKVGPETYEARSIGLSGAGVHSLRRSLLLRTVRTYRPDVLLVDHAPLGMRGELLPALRWLKERGGCTTILGMRDIIDAPESVLRVWESEGVVDVLRGSYDHIAIYGSPEVFDPVEAYQLPADVAAKATFVHYVTPESQEVTEPVGATGDRPRVAVSIGGGDGGVETVLRPFLDLLSRRPAPAFSAEILTGPLVSRDVLADLRARAVGLPVTLHTFLTDPTRLYRAADLVVSTSGYNTTVELLAHARRAVLVPRALHRQEQAIRARRLAELGLVQHVAPADVNPARLGAAIRRGLAGPEVLRLAREQGSVPLDGAARFAELCGRLCFGERAAPARTVTHDGRPGAARR